MVETKTVVVTSPRVVVGYGKVEEGEQVLPTDIAVLLVTRGAATEPKLKPTKQTKKEGDDS